MCGDRLGKMRGLHGGNRLADRIVKAADARKTSLIAKAIRVVAGLGSRPIPLYSFRGRENFGDVLSAVVVEYVSGANAVLVSARTSGKLLAVGSIMHRLRPGDWVWGTGAIAKQPISPPSNVKFFAVRGPLTRDLVNADVPETYGDPAILLPRIYTPQETQHFQVGLIPHYQDQRFVRVTDPSVLTIDVLADWREVIDRIVGCELVLSSSLHGLIVAEAYGVPAGWMSVSDQVLGKGFKFHDYYLGTGRDVPKPVRWGDGLAKMVAHIEGPPRLTVEPLLRAWPESLSFRSPPSPA
jgi:pyruvyltransferase